MKGLKEERRGEKQRCEVDKERVLGFITFQFASQTRQQSYSGSMKLDRLEKD